jgi:D-alanine-D-alanine ligase
MQIGITFDLRDEYIAQGFSEEETAEFDREDTVRAIEHALQDLGFLPDRIGTLKQLTQRLARGDHWNLVFNIAEGMHGYAREAQVPALLDAYEIPYTFSDPLVLSLTLHKAMTKRVVRDLGIPTPEFSVVETEEDVERITLPFPLFAKPVAEGTGKGVTAESKITGPAQLRDTCARLLHRYQQPVLVESFLPGREFTVGIVGTGTQATAIGVAEVVLQPGAEPQAYSYVNKEHCEDVVEYQPARGPSAERAAELALAAWRGLGCRDAGRVDFREDHQGAPMFIEVNPLAGLHPHHSDLPIIGTLVGMPYLELIAMIMESALKRASTQLSRSRTKIRNGSFSAETPDGFYSLPLPT